MLLEHHSVYTAGKRTRPADRPTDGTPVVDVDRGGLITWHGPGQLVGYPIVGLAAPLDVVDFVRRLEEALIRVVADLGIAAAGRVPGRTGVWVPADGRAPGAQGRRDRAARAGRGHAARVRAQLRSRPGRVRQDRAVRHHRRRGHARCPRSSAARSRSTSCASPPRPRWPTPWTAGCRWPSTRSPGPGPGRPGPAAAPLPGLSRRPSPGLSWRSSVRSGSRCGPRIGGTRPRSSPRVGARPPSCRAVAGRPGSLGSASSGPISPASSWSWPGEGGGRGRCRDRRRLGLPVRLRGSAPWRATVG